MRILRVITSMNPKIGGPTEGIRQMQNALKIEETDLSCEIVCMDNPNDEWITHSELVIHALGKKNNIYSFSRKFNKFLEKNVSSFDLVIIHGIWQYHSISAYQACKKHNIPYYLYTHGMLDPWFKETYPLKHIKKLIYWLLFEKNVVNNARGVIFTCEEEKILARKSFPFYRPKEIVTVYGTAGSTLSKEKAIATFYDKFPNLKQKKVILFMGRIHEKKGCDLLVHAFYEIKKKHDNIHLLFAGPDDSSFATLLKQECKKLQIEEFVTWGGMLQGVLKWGAYHASNIFCLPSHQENFGIVVAEALSCSRSVLISNKVNIWREIEAYKAGFIADDTVEGITEILTKWFNLSDKEVEKFNVNARKCFFEKFDIKIAAQRFLEIIDA